MAVTHKLRKPVESLQALRSQRKTLVAGVFLALAIAGVLALLLWGCVGSATPVSPPPPPVVQPLQAADEQNIVQATVNSENVEQPM